MKRTICAVILLMTMLTAVIPSAGAVDVSLDATGPYAEEADISANAAGRSVDQAVGATDAAAPVVEEKVLNADEALAPVGKEKSVTDYTYKIEPLLAPFNQYFFVKTDNPDPYSFRFIDKSTKYSDKPDTISVVQSYSEDIVLFADVRYDNEATGRVGGGYIFASNGYSTDGGTVVLQYGDGYWWSDWEDTNVKLTLPALKDSADYLIDTYAKKTAFFDNMYAVQDGFEEICLYSGSYIRGELKKTDPYWFAAIGGHIDQSFYIYSPYDRSDSESLFASAIYPFRYDSLGFPSMMAEVSQRLDSASSYQWNQQYHWLVDVTYNGETRSFGGAGNIEGQGISKDKILQYYTFKSSDPKITLNSAYSLLVKYAKVEMDDDIPREDALTWEFMCDTVGDGAWVRLSNSHMKAGGHWSFSDPTYTYLYSNENTNYISDDEWGVGYRTYYGGKLGYFRDAWVDGRYINEWRHIVPGATFAEHPTGDIYVKNVTIPLVTIRRSYEYDDETSSYKANTSVQNVTETKKNILFEYNSESDMWIMDFSEFGYQIADYDTLRQLVADETLDAKYLDMVTLTHDEVEAMQVDRKTNDLPMKGYIFDGTAEPGTPFGFDYLIGDADGNNAIEVVDATFMQRYIAGLKTPYSEDELLRGDTDLNDQIELPDATAIQYYLAGMKTTGRIGEKILG